MKKVEKRMSMKAVAEAANVSVATVSRVLNQTGYVKKETKEHVQKIIDDLGYRRNFLAKSLRNLKSQYIALIVPDIENEYFAVMSRWIEHSLQAQGYGVFISSIEQSPKKARWYAELYADQFVAGAILLTDDNEAINVFNRAHIPVVVADRLEDKKIRQNVSFIGSDNEDGGYIAAKTLIERGARRLLLLRDEQNLTNVNERQKGFLRGIEESGKKDIELKIIPTEVCRDKVYNEIYGLYQDWAFDALFATSDYMAIPAMAGLMKNGISIPEKLQIIGYDGVPSVYFTTPSMATITQSLDDIGTKIAEVMKKMIEVKNYQVDFMLAVKLQEGDSLKRI